MNKPSIGDQALSHINTLKHAESTLHWCLNDAGMTNEQAIRHIKERHGTTASIHCDTKLREWRENDVDDTLTVE